MKIKNQSINFKKEIILFVVLVSFPGFNNILPIHCLWRDWSNEANESLRKGYFKLNAKIFFRSIKIPAIYKNRKMVYLKK